MDGSASAKVSGIFFFLRHGLLGAVNEGDIVDFWLPRNPMARAAWWRRKSRSAAE